MASFRSRRMDLQGHYVPQPIAKSGKWAFFVGFCFSNRPNDVIANHFRPTFQFSCKSKTSLVSIWETSEGAQHSANNTSILHTNLNLQNLSPEKHTRNYHYNCHWFKRRHFPQSPWQLTRIESENHLMPWLDTVVSTLSSNFFNSWKMARTHPLNRRESARNSKPMGHQDGFGRDQSYRFLPVQHKLCAQCVNAWKLPGLF